MPKPLSVPELMHLRTAYSRLLTTPAIRERFDAMCRENPALDEKRRAEQDYVYDWLQSAGVCTDERLRTLVPPIPPKELREITAATDAEMFLFTGLLDVASFLFLFHRHHAGLAPHARPRILDFGAGCGRMVRFFSGNEDKYAATASEVNPDHAAWMKANLPGITVLQNGPMPPLPGNDRFDLIYSLSVFTHLSAPATHAWMEEVHARLHPNGILIVTIHGDRALEITADSPQHQELMRLSAGSARGIRANLNREGFVYLCYDPDILRIANAGADYGISFIHPDYLRNAAARLFDLVDFIPAAVRGWQDIAVLKRRG